MKVNIQEHTSVIVVKLNGDLTVHSTEQLKTTVTDLVAIHRKAMVFDMCDVGFIDSEGLELLLWIRDYLRLSLISFRLVGLSQYCAKILEITRLEAEFTCSEDISKAIKSLA
jgi:anti-anti-sigma factor